MNKLKNRAFLNTRPKAQAGELSHLLLLQGAKVFELASLEIIDAPHSENALKILQDAKHCDYAIFVSANAVNFAQRYWNKEPSTKIIAVGSGTAAALKKAGFTVDLIPADFSSEGLLRLEELSSVNNKNILIFCGENSKSLLTENLLKRGAKVSQCICYTRRCPSLTADESSQLITQQFDAIISTSKESLENLYSMITSNQAKTWLINQQLLVIAPSMVELAKELGFKKQPWLAEKATPPHLVNFLTKKLDSGHA